MLLKQMENWHQTKHNEDIYPYKETLDNIISRRVKDRYLKHHQKADFLQMDTGSGSAAEEQHELYLELK